MLEELEERMKVKREKLTREIPRFDDEKTIEKKEEELGGPSKSADIAL
jgi:hypothetical protein